MPAVTPQQLRRSRWLRGLRRVARWTWLPALAVVALLGPIGLSRAPWGQPALELAEDRLVALSGALGLVVADIQVDGREVTDRDAVLAALGARSGTPILAISPARAKERLERLPWVRSATVERRLPDTLYVHLVERKPLAIWQHHGRLELIDRDGGVIPLEQIPPARLLTVVGDDAAAHAVELIDMLAGEPALAARVTAAMRVGARRWTLRIDNIEVLLPEQNPAAAWAQLARLERSDALLQRDIQAIDMRLPDRLVLRVNHEPAKDAPPTKKGRVGAKNT
jgi:cell division protein FtsQ